MSSFFDFIVDLIDVSAWPLLIFVGVAYFREEVRKVTSRIVDGEFFGIKLKLESEKEYSEVIKELEASKDPEEKVNLAKKIVQPEKSRLTLDEGANLVAKDIIDKMEVNFDLDDVKNKFDSLFSSDPRQLENYSVKNFKKKVLVAVRSSKEVIETQKGEQIFFKKVEG
ncbi:hypothetical protein [Vreelandella aquamarina]|uniref:hypothetical protein n=1 Tax=Vreelandella aquamarina TaxID=77097 RepID=UPI00078544EB|nr:hypothetical protein [Halomonas axialensis]